MPSLPQLYAAACFAKCINFGGEERHGDSERFPLRRLHTSEACHFNTKEDLTLQHYFLHLGLLLLLVNLHAAAAVDRPGTPSRLEHPALSHDKAYHVRAKGAIILLGVCPRNRDLFTRVISLPEVCRSTKKRRDSASSTLESPLLTLLVMKSPALADKGECRVGSDEVDAARPEWSNFVHVALHLTTVCELIMPLQQNTTCGAHNHNRAPSRSIVHNVPAGSPTMKGNGTRAHR